MERGGWVLEIVEEEKRERMKGGGGGVEWRKETGRDRGE